MSNWVELDKSNVRNVAGYDKRGWYRVFGLNGEPFPRIVIGIMLNTLDPEEGYSVEISGKDKGGDWWGRRALPLELFPAMVDLLKEVTAEKESLVP